MVNRLTVRFLVKFCVDRSKMSKLTIIADIIPNGSYVDVDNNFTVLVSTVGLV